MIKNHKKILFNRRFGACGFYPLPIIFYWYFHSMVMGIVLFLQIFGGYYTYFYQYGDVFSLNVFLYFFYWLSFMGIVNLSYLIATGALPATLLSVLSILLTILAYPIYLYSFRKFKEKLRVQEVVALFFLFPYWILVLVVQFSSNIRWILPTERKNWWVK